MEPDIRQLKHRYRVNIALNQVLPLADMGFSMPLSTGSPLFDAALTEKLQTSASLTEAEHLQRSWELCSRASADEISALQANVGGVLNNFRLLLAMTCWDRGEHQQAREFIDTLPWHWRFAFPIAVLKPAAHFFTGWRRDTKFRLVQNPHYSELRILFGDLLDQAHEVALLKYRATVKEAAALQRYRFDGSRQNAIHDLCFNNGRSMVWPESEGGVIRTYVDARDACADSGVEGMITVLNASSYHIPLTSYMGLLGNAQVKLLDDRISNVEQLRDYAIRSSTAVEILLRLSEWSPWLEPRHIDELSEKVTTQIIGRQQDIPFFRVISAFNTAPRELRKQLVKPMLRPLMENFGRQVRDLLPPPGPVTFVMPANIFRMSSFLLYAVVAHITSTRFLLVGEDGVTDQPEFDLDEILEHLADDPDETVRWLLAKFGSRALDHSDGWFSYDVDRLASILASEVDPAAPLVLDLPLFYSESLLRSLASFERIFNLSSSMGAPGELSISPSYYRKFSYTSPLGSYSRWGRNADSAARNFTEVLDRLRWFEALGRHAEVQVVAA